MNGFEMFVLNHIVASLSTATVLGGATAFLAQKLPGLARKESAAIDAALLAKIQSPTGKKLALGIEKAIDDALPDAGDAKYALAADAICSAIPQPESALARPLVLALLQGLGSGAKAGIADALSQEEPPKPA